MFERILLKMESIIEDVIAKHLEDSCRISQSQNVYTDGKSPQQIYWNFLWMRLAELDPKGTRDCG